MPKRSRKVSGKPRSRNLPLASGSAGFGGGGGSNFLNAAADVLAGSSDAGADEPWTPERFRVARDRQVRLLESWADRDGLWIELRQLGQIEPGGKEHDLFPEVEEGRRIFKVTKGGGFGWHPICERLVGRSSDEFQLRLGTPLQYFRRLLLVNELFPALNQLDGFVHVQNRFEIVASQPFLKGRNATLAEIARYLERQGFAHVCNSAWFRAADNLAIFDAGEPNILVSEGHMVPIDIIPLRVSGHFLHRLVSACKNLANRRVPE